MRVLDNAVFIEAHKNNFSSLTRSLSSIKYIVIHYTGNKGDTARNNALYFRDANIQTSAHFFVSGTDIYQSVNLNHAAFAVGLGSRKEPYFRWPELWKKANNNNSVSIEICGYPNSLEADDETKRTAAMLAVDLMEKIGLTPSCLCRHYDITGKCCPAWAVNDPLKWLDFKLLVTNMFYGKEEDEMLIDSPENYSVFKTFMDRWLAEQDAKPMEAWETPGMTYCEQYGLIRDGKPKGIVTRSQLATVLMRLDKK